MLTLKSSLSSHKSNAYGFVGALLLHIPIIFFALDLEIMPQKADMLKMETTGSLEFSLASFVVTEPVEDRILDPIEPEVTQPLPKTYEPPKEPKETKKQKPKEKIKEKHIAIPKPVKQEQPKKKEEPTTESVNASAVAHHSNAEAGEPIKLGGSNHENPFLLEVKRLIDQHNSYPRVARRMGLTGEVIVRLVLEKNGNIAELKILESSTHSILDNQTLKAIRDASKMFPKPDKDYILDIPIEYQLKRG